MAEVSDSGTVGARLKRTREDKRMSLRQIANTTKIAVSALDAIERDDVRKLPGGIFARAFVRAYSAELGLDVERTVSEYFAQFPGVIEPAPSATVVYDDTKGSTRRIPAALVRTLAVGIPAAALILWVIFGWSAALPVPEGPVAAPVQAAASDAAPVAPAVADVVPAGGPLPDDGPAAAAALTLHITAQRACWVSVTADGREVLSRLMGAGEDQAVGAGSELRVKVGDASAVTLRLNGAPVRPLGGVGQVVTIRIDSSNAATLLDTH